MHFRNRQDVSFHMVLSWNFFCVRPLQKVATCCSEFFEPSGFSNGSGEALRTKVLWEHIESAEKLGSQPPLKSVDPESCPTGYTIGKYEIEPVRKSKQDFGTNTIQNECSQRTDKLEAELNLL